MTAPSKPKAEAGFVDGASVHQGEDRWLFLVGGTNNPIASYGYSARRWLRLAGWTRLLKTRHRRAQALGIRFVQLIAPEKLSIYRERAPALDYDAGRSPARALAMRASLRATVVNTPDAMEAAKEQDDLFYRTDTHWSYEGCHAAYGALCSAVGARPISLADYDFIEQDLAGDLGVKLDPPQSEMRRSYLFPRRATRAYANDLVQEFIARGRLVDLHRGAHVGYRNEHPDADPRRVLLFGDSCSHFEPIFLTGMMADTFRALDFVWSASVDWALVERLRPDILVCEIAERFLARVPGDTFDLDTFVAEKLAATRAAA